MVTLAAGTVLAMWIGELITERGIGNGISFIIFAGIVARVPQGVGRSYLVRTRTSPAASPSSSWPSWSVAAIVYIQEGQRRIPDPVRQPRPRPAHVPGRRDVPAAARQPGRRHPDHLRGQHPALPDPDRALLRRRRRTRPSSRPSINQIADGVVNFLSPTGIPYIVFYFLLTMGFTYFYTAFTFKPDETADQLRKNGGFIPGIRPGRAHARLPVQGRLPLSLAGAIFLGVVAVSPIILPRSFAGSVVGGFASAARPC